MKVSYYWRFKYSTWHLNVIQKTNSSRVGFNQLLTSFKILFTYTLTGEVFLLFLLFSISRRCLLLTKVSPQSTKVSKRFRNYVIMTASFRTQRRFKVSRSQARWKFSMFQRCSHSMVSETFRKVSKACAMWVLALLIAHNIGGR